MAFEEHVRVTECPCCRTRHDLASGLNTGDGPEPGDVTLCIACGHFAVFTARMTLRRPTSREARALARDPDAQRARQALQDVKPPPH